MAVKQDIKICDFCNNRIAKAECSLCGKDLCNICGRPFKIALNVGQSTEEPRIRPLPPRDSPLNISLPYCKECSHKIKPRTKGYFEDKFIEDLKKNISGYIKKKTILSSMEENR